jgi:ATP-dependent DNA ligase
MQTIEFPKFKNYNGQKVNWFQPKLDGHLTKINTTNYPDIYCYTKNNKNITEKLLKIKHIRKEILNIPKNSIAFAELHCPGVPATSVPTLLNNADERLLLTFFAAPLWDNKNFCNDDLDNVLFNLKKIGLSIASPTYIPKSFVDETGQAAMLELAVSNKWEGWVLKEEHMKNWYKLKPVKTFDAFVIGTHRSFSSTHYGGLQAIHIAVYDKDGKIHDFGQVGSGFDLEYRQYLDTQEKRDKLIGKVCVIAYDSIAANGKLKFPRMAKDRNDNIIWRNDKDPKQCTMEQFE